MAQETPQNCEVYCEVISPGYLSLASCALAISLSRWLLRKKPKLQTSWVVCSWMCSIHSKGDRLLPFMSHLLQFSAACGLVFFWFCSLISYSSLGLWLFSECFVLTTRLTWKHHHLFTGNFPFKLVTSPLFPEAITFPTTLAVSKGTTAPINLRRSEELTSSTEML